MNPPTDAALVNEVSNGPGNGRISFKPGTHAGTVGNHSIGVFRNFSPRGRSNTRYSMYELSEGETTDMVVRKSVFINGDMR